jgi:hypothetical protein
MGQRHWRHGGTGVSVTAFRSSFVPAWADQPISTGGCASPRRARAFRQVEEDDMRSIPWVLTILVLTTPVTGVAQRSKSGVPLDPTKPSQIVTLQTLSTPCPLQGTGLWLADTQSLRDGTTALFPGIPPARSSSSRG